MRNCLTFVAVLGLVSAPAATAAGPNLLDNPQFAGDPDAEDFGWHIRYGAGPDVVEIVADTEMTLEGSPSLRFRQEKPVYSAVSQAFVPEPRTIYAAQVWVRAEDFVTTSRGVRLFIGDENARTLTADRLWAHQAGTGWHTLTCVFNSGDRPQMYVIPMLNNVCGTVWFARPSLRVVSPAEAGELTGRAHGYGWVAPEPETGVAYFGRGTAHVHPQFPAVVWLSNRNAFEDPQAAGMRMVVELPEGVEAAGTYRAWDLEQTHGDAGTRAVLTGVVPYCPVWLSTTWEPGRSGTGRVWLEWDGGRQEPAHRFELRCIEMPMARRPERLICGLSGISTSVYPGDAVEYARRLGLNAVNLWLTSRWPAEPIPSVVEQVEAWRHAGFMASANYSPMNYPHYDELLAAEEDAQACTIDGTRIPTKPCPSYRGNAWQHEGRMMANMAASGISWAHMDEEVYDGHGICFCERCLRRWEEYRAEHYPELEAVSPLQFEGDPDDYPEHHEAWTRFKCWLVTDMFAGWRRMLLDEVAARGAQSSPQPWLDSWLSMSTHLDKMYYNLHDPEMLPQGLDHLVPMLYDRAGAVRDQLLPLVEAAGRENLLVGLTLGEPSNGRQVFPPEEGRAQVLEAAFAPTMGYVLWTYPRSDAGTLAAIARANDVLARIEDTLLDGEPSDLLSVADGAGDVTAYRRNDELVALVRDYDDPGEVRLRVAEDETWRVEDADLRETIAEVAGAEREFGVDLGERNPVVLVLRRGDDNG
ncbi:MAG: hypothetical protein U9R79_22550 [Armatimonadota bacterium]|nr:hypothetical protein [Armatimonadota bacterium]